MKTFAQFKQEMDIPSITLLQGKGRMFADVRDKHVVVSKGCDLKKPMFVIPLTQLVGEGDAQTQITVPNAYLLVNGTGNVKEVATV